MWDLFNMIKQRRLVDLLPPSNTFFFFNINSLEFDLTPKSYVDEEAICEAYRAPFQGMSEFD